MRAKHQEQASRPKIIDEYLQALQIEVNPSKSYQIITEKALTKLSQFHSSDSISFEDMDRKDILSFLNSLRKSDKKEMHSWIGT